MALATAAREAETRDPRAPRRSVLWSIAVAGCVAAGLLMWLALTSDHVPEPGLQGVLTDWITLPYILAGVFAWSRRPDSRFGPLMIAAGFALFLSSLGWAGSRSTCFPRSSSCTSSWRSRAVAWSIGSSACWSLRAT
jgi:hypothetical protein